MAKFDPESPHARHAVTPKTIETELGVEVLGDGSYPLGNHKWQQVCPITEEVAQALLLNGKKPHFNWFINKAYAIYYKDVIDTYAVYRHDWSWYIIRQDSEQ